MRTLLPVLALTLVACGGDGPTAPSGVRPFVACGDVAPYVPTGGWRSACPPAVGLDSARLRVAIAEAESADPTLLALVVARRGYVAMEAYWHGARETTPIDLRSVTKAVTATAVANAIQRGRISSMEAPLAGWFPEYVTNQPDPRKAGLTVRHLLDLTAGYEQGSQGTVTSNYAGWALTRPLADDPGTRWWYDEALYKVLSTLVRRADGRPMQQVARDELFAPLGLAGAASRWPVDQWGDAEGAAGLTLTAREMLTIGELYRRDGVWDGRRILPEGWVAPMRVRRDGLADDTQVWFRAWRQVVLAGHVTIFALGYGGQYIVVVPDLDLVVAAGARPDVDPQYFPHVLTLVRDHIIPAAGG